jgi:hypothetical protein
MELGLYNTQSLEGATLLRGKKKASKLLNLDRF